MDGTAKGTNAGRTKKENDQINDERQLAQDLEWVPLGLFKDIHSKKSKSLSRDKTI